MLWLGLTKKKKKNLVRVRRRVEKLILVATNTAGDVLTSLLRIYIFGPPTNDEMRRSFMEDVQWFHAYRS